MGWWRWEGTQHLGETRGKRGGENHSTIKKKLMKKTVTVYDKFSRLKDMLCPFPVQMKEKKMLTCSVEWGCEHSFLRSRTFSDEIPRGWTLVGSAHEITSVLQGVFCRSWWGQQTLSAEKGPVLFPRLGEPHHLCASEMLLDFSQSRLFSISCVPTTARGFPSHCLSLCLSVPGA